MTNITISTFDDRRRVVADGHSGYGESGNDIVCAGISALTQAYALECMEQTEVLNLRVSPGYLDVTVVINDKEETLLKMMARGLECIQNEYEKYIKINYSN